ncbi:MAG: ABC transporter permease [Isosphaeraceae bacterium]
MIEQDAAATRADAHLNGRTDLAGAALPATDAAEGYELVIRPQPGWIAIDWREMWAYRELLVFLTWRDISVRYKQTVLGVAWAVVQPLMMMLIFTLIFGRFMRVPTTVPYPVFVFAGLMPWTFFSQGFGAAAISLANQQALLTKVYFPRLFVPVSAAMVFLVDMAIAMSLYAALMIIYGVAPSWGLIWLPLLIALTIVATLGLGVTLAALTVFYRDFKHIVPFLTMILMYTAPVAYPITINSPLWRTLLALNPMFGIVAAYRSAILGLPWDLPSLAISATTAVGSFIFALFYFRRTERAFADYA